MRPRQPAETPGVPLDRERGAAVVFVAGSVALLLAIGAGLGAAAGLVAAHRQAQSAADLAALAGAQSQQLGLDGCAFAAELATANGGRLQSCSASIDGLSVEVEVSGPHWLGLAHDPVARARAGPGH